MTEATVADRLGSLTVERLAERYDLLTPVAVGQGRVLWQAHDQVLDRGVGVLLLERGDPRAERVRAAAQAAAAVEHPHLQQVVDVDDDDGRVFVVTRWSAAHTLADVIVGRTMRADDAAELVAQIADALAASDAVGLHHCVLDPRDVLVAESGAVVTGLGVRAAISETDDGGATLDVRRLGALLYATLTGRWPDGDCAGLPAAPTVDGAPARPRQVRAGVPAVLDDITWRALGFPGDGPALESPADVAKALDAAVEDRSTAREPHEDDDRPGRPSTAVVVGLLAVVAILATGVVLLGLQVWADRTAEPPSPAASSVEPTPTRTSASPTPGTPVSVPIGSVSVFDPQGDETENDDLAPAAVDDDLTTAWTTVTYTTRDLGGLKQGVGLVLELKRRTPVAGVDLELLGRGTDLQVLTTRGDPFDLDGYRLASEVAGAGDRLTLRFAPAVPADAVLIWLTGLPAAGNGYQGGIADVVVRGS